MCRCVFRASTFLLIYFLASKVPGRRLFLDFKTIAKSLSTTTCCWKIAEIQCMSYIHEWSSLSHGRGWGRSSIATPLLIVSVAQPAATDSTVSLVRIFSPLSNRTSNHVHVSPLHFHFKIYKLCSIFWRALN